jgi:cytosine/adenosine deaminase-related metal-dependent hydrolase
MAQMRLALQAQRARECDHHTVERDLRRKAVDALRMATLGGAEVMDMGSLIGSIARGKKADLVIFRCDDIDTVPVVDPIATVVFHASPKNIDTVIVDGKIVKQNGRLVGVDWEFLHDQMIRRSQRLRDEAAKVDMEKAESLFRSVFEKAM